mmetsp:Transcript_22176/g.44040  ORF Transcript_22176/g.44040 Transcript_22176/m.44040 type:complete len:279 (-) Transcript_22176:2704-3540(-)
MCLDSGSSLLLHPCLASNGCRAGMGTVARTGWFRYDAEEGHGIRNSGKYLGLDDTHEWTLSRVATSFLLLLMRASEAFLAAAPCCMRAMTEDSITVTWDSIDPYREASSWLSETFMRYHCLEKNSQAASRADSREGSRFWEKSASSSRSTGICIHLWFSNFLFSFPEPSAAVGRDATACDEKQKKERRAKAAPRQASTVVGALTSTSTGAGVATRGATPAAAAAAAAISASFSAFLGLVSRRDRTVLQRPLTPESFKLSIISSLPAVCTSCCLNCLLA